MALLADVQYGFPGEITPTAWASIIGNASGGVFGVGAGYYGGINELKLTTNSVGDRGAVLSTGLAYGHGCIGIWNSTTQFNFTAPAGTADRWDCIVVRRTWSNTPGASVTTLAVKNGTSGKSLPALTINPGTLTEQPLWLVRVRGGQTAIQEIVDLRCFAGNGGVQAMNTLALGYLENPGSRVEVDGTVYEFRANAGTTSIGWEAISSSTRVPLWAAGSPLAGSLSNAANGFLLQAGSTVATSDASGYGRITFPKAFPNGLLFVAGFDGDDWAGGGSLMYASAGRSDVWGSSGYGNKNDWVYAVKVQPNSDDGVGSYRIARIPGKLHRINWIAIGF